MSRLKKQDKVVAVAGSAATPPAQKKSQIQQM
jgi:hypothetical protein